MNTECTTGQLEFHGLERRTGVGQFDGSKISSDSEEDGRARGLSCNQGDGKRIMAANMTGLKAPIVTTAESKFLLPIPLHAGG